MTFRSCSLYVFIQWCYFIQFISFPFWFAVNRHDKWNHLRCQTAVGRLWDSNDWHRHSAHCHTAAKKRQSSSNNQLRHITSASKRPNETMMMSKRRTWEDFSSYLSHRLQAVVKSMNVDRKQAARWRDEGKSRQFRWQSGWVKGKHRETRVEPISATSHFHFIPIALSSMLNIENLRKSVWSVLRFRFSRFFIWILKVSESSSSSSLWSTFKCFLQIASSRFNLVSLVVALLLRFVDVIKPCEVLWPCTHNFVGWRVGNKADENQIQTTYLLYKTISGRQIVSLGTWSISTPLY